VVICLDRGADLHMAQLMPLPLTVSCFSKIRIGFTFLVPAHPGSPGKRAVNLVCVCYFKIWRWYGYGINNTVTENTNGSMAVCMFYVGIISCVVLFKVLVAIHYSVLDARNGYIRNVVV